MDEVADGIYLIDPGHDGEIAASGVYLVLGERAALVDVGPTIRAVAIPERLRDLGVDADKLAYILLTHVHVDHSGAAGYLSQIYPNARVVVHQTGARHLIDPSKLIEGTRAVFGDNIAELCGSIDAVPPERVLATVGCEIIDLGGGRCLRVTDTPGHTLNHQSYYDERTHGVFTGESMGFDSGRGLVYPAIAPPLFDVIAAISSARKTASLMPERFYLAHGGVQDNIVGAAEHQMNVILSWAEVARQAMRENPSVGHVTACVQKGMTETYRAAGAGRGIAAAPTPHSVYLTVGGLMGFFSKFGLDVDLSAPRVDTDIERTTSARE
ncbi:MAG: MBL fold metallo-hydrolase [Chloroflexota bacterium]|nr:MAG: MBL fold metallo-hydrolase [Chloroflexota bacterium]